MSSKYRLMAERPFFAGGRAPEQPPVPTVRASTPYEASVDKNKAKLQEGEIARKLISQKPFYTTVHSTELFADTVPPVA